MNPQRTQHGFALVDSLLALLLFAVVLLAVMAALLRAMHATHDAVQTGRTVDRAADQLEERRALSDGAAPDTLAGITLQ